MINKSFRAVAILLLLLTPICVAQSYAGELVINPISLQQSVNMAAQNNFGIALKRIDAKIAAKESVGAQAEFDPTVGALVSTGKTRTANTSAFASPDVGETESLGAKMSLSGKISTGAEYSVSLEAREDSTNSSFASINPSHTASLKLEATLPILKGYGANVNRWLIVTYLNKEDIAMSALRQSLSKIITSVHEVYWELVFREENLKAQREALARARDMERRVRVQVAVGSLAPIEIVSAEAFVASSEEKVISAEHTVGKVADQLLKLINPPSDGAMWAGRLGASESRVMPPPSPDLAQSVNHAMKTRPEILARQKEIDNSKIELVYRENQKWPSLDVVASLSLNGIRGDARPVINFDESQSESSFGGGWGEVREDVVSGDYYNYLIGLRLTFPLGARNAKAKEAIAGYHIQKNIMKLKELEKDIIIEVREAVRAIETGKKQVAAARLARDLAQKKLEAETLKFEVGASTAFNVLVFQKDLAQERSNELKALAEAQKAIARYHLAAGSTLEHNRLSLN